MVVKKTVICLLMAVSLCFAGCHNAVEQEIVDVVKPTPTALPTATLAPTPEPMPTPEPTPEPDPNAEKLAEAQKINDDVIGWVSIPNTNIDYPILYAFDKKWYYNDHDINKKKSNEGTIYTYYSQLLKNNPVTGHNMRVAGTMFHELHKLQDEADSLKTYENRIFRISLFGYTKWEVFALYEVKKDEPTKTILYNTKQLQDVDEDEIQEWITKQKKRSEVDLDVEVSTEDVFMTLVTCGDNYDSATAQSRLYYFLKAVE